MKEPQLKRIGIDARFVIDSEHPHGALLRELLKDNKENNHPFEYVLFHVNPLPSAVWLDCLNVSSVLLEGKKWGERWFYWLVLDPAVANAKLDLFISPFYRLPLLSWLVGTPMLHMIHDVSQLTVQPALLPERFHSRWKRLQVRIGFLVFSRVSKRTITVSQHAATEIGRTLWLSHSRIAVVPNCINEAELLSNSEKSGEFKYLIFVGANMPKKNLAGLLEAWPRIHARFPDARLIVRSDVAGEERAACHEGILVRGEYLSRSKLQNLIRYASALVLPSFHEGFGLPVLEAMALGTPVCVSSGTALEEVAGEAGILFDPYSADSIAEACCAVLGYTSVERQRQCDRGRRRAQQYSRGAVLPGLQALILDCCRHR